jgi:diaminohydroxyphosphoribosylaminopyrimidine deaminase/5-amino-6-(5-phosphoribosylamino)uracil reductase
MRLAHDAVMVGSGTALADDPDLTVRDMGAVRQPIRIVLDRLLRHSPESRLGRTAKDHPVWLLHGPTAPTAAREAWEVTGATLIETPEIAGHLDLKAALQTLAAKGLTRILSEGGSTIAAALIGAGLVDDLALFSGGVLIGGAGHSALGALASSSLPDAPRPVLRSIEQMGRDSYSLWSVP